MKKFRLFSLTVLIAIFIALSNAGSFAQVAPAEPVDNGGGDCITSGKACGSDIGLGKCCSGLVCTSPNPNSSVGTCGYKL